MKKEDIIIAISGIIRFLPKSSEYFKYSIGDRIGIKVLLMSDFFEAIGNVMTYGLDTEKNAVAEFLKHSSFVGAENLTDYYFIYTYYKVI